MTTQKSTLEQYALINLDAAASQLKNLFTHIPLDPYLKEGYRAKKIVRFKVNGNTVIRQPHGPLFQSNEYNPVHGNIIREYQEIEAHLITPVLKHIIKTFAHQFNLNAEEEILLQAQRIYCGADTVGHPAVEGWHKDGTNFLGLVCVDRYNIEGAKTMLASDRKGQELFFEKILTPGQFLLFDDRECFHYTTPIKLSDPGFKKGYRDVLILCTPSCRKK